MAKSPFVEDAEIELLNVIDTKLIRDEYIKSYGYDPKKEFDGINELSLYKCAATGVKFFWPLSTAGEEGLYKALQKFSWNYKEQKWEHDNALGLIPEGSNVLDVGCGEGSFIARASSLKNAMCHGIEFNSGAVEVAKSKGLDVRHVSLDMHALEFTAYYDVVTSFQVLEHVSDPNEFISQLLKCLKPGGLLVLATPNEHSFLGQLDMNVLNMPPHHLTLWGENAYRSLGDLHDIDLISCTCEPLQEVNWYTAFFEKKYIKGYIKEKIWYKFGFSEIFKRFVEENKDTIKGHTIIAVFKKHN